MSAQRDPYAYSPLYRPVARPVRPTVHARDWNFVCSQRRPLGSVVHGHAGLDQPCAYCWPRLITSDVIDGRGAPCCAQCAMDDNRVRRLPA